MHTLVVVIYILARVVWIVAVECARRMDTLLCILLLWSILRRGPPTPATRVVATSRTRVVPRIFSSAHQP